MSNRFSIQHLILHVNQTAEYLSVLYSSSSSRFKGNSSGDIWEFIEFVDQPSSVIDWTSNHHYQNNNRKFDERNIPLNSSQGLIPSGLTVRPFERRALNFLVNEYLLTNNYKLTSVTFGEENDTADLEDWDNVGLNCPRPPDLNQLYRWYCHQLSVEDEKPEKVDFEMFINFDAELHQEHRNLQKTVQQMVKKPFYSPSVLSKTSIFLGS